MGCRVLHTAKCLGARQEKAWATAARAGMTVALLGSLLLAACSTGSKAPSLTTSAIGSSGLNAAQVAAVTEAARQMTRDPAAAAHGLRGRTEGPAVHVCGYVNSNAGPDTPIYVELRESAGQVGAERGQTGATPTNLAKVRFMCRQHGDW